MLELPEPTAGTLWKLEYWLIEGLEGRMPWPKAIRHALAELGEHQERERKIQAARDFVVTENREGLVTRNPASTSAKAARRVEPKTGTQRAAILVDIVTHNGSTDYELSHRLRLLASSVRPRRGELAASAFVVNSGRTRKHRGTEWIIWAPTAEGLAWFHRQGTQEAA